MAGRSNEEADRVTNALCQIGAGWYEAYWLSPHPEPRRRRIGHAIARLVAESGKIHLARRAFAGIGKQARWLGVRGQRTT